MKYLGLLIILAINIQCKTPNNKSKNKKVYFKTDINFMSTNESRLQLKHLAWNIYIFDKDSIILLSTLKQNKEDLRLNNQQFFGRIKKSNKYTYEIKISNYFGIESCVKALNRSLDSIPFFIDSTLLKSVGFWKLKVDKSRDTLIIDNLNFSYETNSKNINEKFVMSIIPNEKSILFPVVIQSRPLCAVNMSKKIPKNKFYLNNLNGKYELIIKNNNNIKIIKLILSPLPHESFRVVTAKKKEKTTKIKSY